MRFINSLIYTCANVLRKFGVRFNEQQDARVIAMRKEITRLGKIEFKIEQYPDGSWSAESVNIDGIVTGTSDIREMGAMIRDAIFTYFNIPPHLCVDALLKADNEPATGTQRVYV